MAEDLVTVTTHTGKKVRVPKNLWEDKNIMSMRAYAVETGQATWNEVNPPEAQMPGIEPPSGIMENLAVSAGRGVSVSGSNVRQLYNELIGNEEGAERERRKQAEIERLSAPARDKFPISSFVGEAVPSFAVPGGKVAQLVAGGIEGGLQGDTVGERATNAALGVGLGFAGQKVGDEIGQAINRRFQRATGNPKAESLDVLARSGIPVSPASRTRDPLARLTEDLQGIITNSRNPLEGSQVKALNRLALRSIGEEGREVTRNTLGKAHTRIGNVFEEVADTVDRIELSDDLVERLGKVADEIGDVETQGASIRRQFERVQRLAETGQFNGEVYNQIRNRLGKASRAAWKQGDELAAETADEIMDVIDDALANSNPDLAGALTDARRQWKMLRVLRRARSINPEGDINQQSLLNAFDQVYPGAQVGKFPGGAEGVLGKTLSAFQEVVRPRQTSRTAENLIRAGIPAGAGIGLLSGNPLAVIGGLGAVGGALSGGGAGAQLGGGTFRSLLRLLEQEQPQEQNTQ